MRNQKLQRRSAVMNAKRHNRSYTWVLSLLLVLAHPLLSKAQETAPKDQSKRPKLGLVLEGGGALGLAHIGVLTWFEEHRIPVNYVAGTSMGGLVGGIYATGRSPAEVKELINGIDWDA